MTALFEIFTRSLRELRSVRSLAVISMFGAVSIVLSSMTLVISSYVQIGFSTIAQQAVYAMFGPGCGFFFAAAMDILKWMIRPTGPFFPGYTLNACAAALIYGYFYYEHKITVRRVLLAEFLVSLICNMLLGTLWITMLYGKSFMAILPLRVFKNLIMLPINTLIFYTLMQALERSGLFAMIRESKKKRP